MTEKARITSIGYSDKDNKAEISNLKKEEVYHFEGMFAGTKWLTVEDGRIVSHSKFKDLPDPINDKKMLPYWREGAAHKNPTQMKFWSDEETNCMSPGFTSSVSFSIQHLCGYNYTEEDYKKNAEKLEKIGFECLRSRRGNDGRYWEIWWLPGLFLAKGKLKRAVEKAKAEKKSEVKEAVRWLSRNVSFGTLDCMVQKLAAVME